MRTCLANPVALHQYFSWRKNLTGRDIEDARRVQNGDVSVGLLCRREDSAARKSDGQN
jgi:hypothetical protein